jgi:acetyl esterase
MKLYPLFCLLILSGLSSTSQMPTAAQIRQSISGDIQRMNVTPQAIYKVENKKVFTGKDSVDVRLYFPSAGKKQKILLNIHGGALVAGDLYTHDNISRVLANRTSSIVVAIDYHRPPESPYPAGLDDCAAVIEWIKKTAATWGGDAGNMSLIGDSGGGLFATSILVKEQASTPFKKVVFINPAVDLRTPGEGLYGLVTKMYLNGRSANDSIISPILATNFASFPPALIITCEKDELKPHGEQLYAKLEAAKVPVQIKEIPNMGHLAGYWSAAHADAQSAIDATVNFLQQSK